MTTYWLIGEKSTSITNNTYEPKNINENTVTNNPSITFQGPDSPASHSLTHSQSPVRNGTKDNTSKTSDILTERDRIKHEIATFVAKDLINNIDNAVREFRLSQNANLASAPNCSKPICNGNDKGLITPTYDKELVINKGKVRDVVNRFNNTINNTNDIKNTKQKSVKNED